jgi:inosose dehydratase
MAPERVLREAAAIGLGAVELGPPGFLPEDPAATRRALDGHGLRLAAGFLAAVLHRAEWLDDSLGTVCSSARTLAGAGADVLILAAATEAVGYDAAGEMSADEWRTLGEALHRARAIGDEFGLEVTLHPHFGTMVESAEQVERLLAESDIPLCLDTGHLLLGGCDPLALVRAAPDRIRHVHLKDVDAALAERVRSGELGYRDAVARGLYRPLGSGDAEIAAIVAELEAAGYAGWYVLEQDAVLEREPGDGEGPAAEAAASLQRILEVSV